MLRLIKTSLIGYFKSPLLPTALFCCLVLGIIHGVKELEYINTDFDYYFYGSVWLFSPLNSMWFKCCTWVLVVLVSLETGREFSDGAIRNKLYTGHTKMSVFLSEVVSASAAAFFCCAAFMIPTVICGRCFFFAIPPLSCLCLLGELLLFFVVWGIFSAVLTMLAANRAVGVTAAMAVMLTFAVINVSLRDYYYNTEPAEIIETEIEYSEDGKPRAVQKTVRNMWYLDGIPKMLVDIEHEADPFSRLYNTCLYGYIHYPERATQADFDIRADIDRQAVYDVLALMLTGAVLVFAGSVIFRRKDLK